MSQRPMMKRTDCPMRHPDNGNCLAAGGFCFDAVSDPICEALHNAYGMGMHDLSMRILQGKKDDQPPLGFDVIDLQTGGEPDLWKIALEEEWAKHLMYCDMEGFAIEQDGTLVLMDECGRFAYPPTDRFKVVFISRNDDTNPTPKEVVALRTEVERFRSLYIGMVKKYADDICDKCANNPQIICGKDCPDYIEGDHREIDGKPVSFRWTCMDLDWGSCPRLESSICYGCYNHDFAGFKLKELSDDA